MPIQGSYTWEETLTHVTYKVPLKGSSFKKVDIHLTNAYVKINYSPFILVIDFPETIFYSSNAHAKVVDGTMVLHLKKQRSGMWHSGSIEKPKIPEEREMLRKRRQKADEERLATENLNKEKASGRKHEDRRFAVRSQMSLEERERQHLENLKQEEKEEAERETYETLSRIRMEEERKLRDAVAHKKSNARSLTAEVFAPALKPPKNEREDERTNELDLLPNTAAPPPTGCDKKIWNREEIGTDVDDSGGVSRSSGVGGALDDDDDDDDDDVVYVPPPRENGRVELNFTPRFFRTPMRESKRNEEEDWLAKNRRHLHKNPNARDVTEQDPQWLKGKGDDFYRSGDFLGAINAYTAAIQTDPKFVAALSNRAACYLHMKRFPQCRDDCTAALRTLSEEEGKATTPTRKSVRARTKLFVRRGSALTAEGHYKRALADYQSALRLDESNAAALASDLETLGRLVRCADLKREGDQLFRLSKMTDAKSKYEELLKIDGCYVSCVSNFAALCLATKDPAGCVSHATRAIELLEDPRGASFASGPVPPKDSKKHCEWLMRTRVRRGAAYAQLGDMSKAERDYSSALDLFPGNEKISRDLSKIRKAMAGGT